VRVRKIEVIAPVSITTGVAFGFKGDTSITAMDG
jgi:hypothetical protein